MAPRTDHSNAYLSNSIPNSVSNSFLFSDSVTAMANHAATASSRINSSPRLHSKTTNINPSSCFSKVSTFYQYQKHSIFTAKCIFSDDFDVNRESTSLNFLVFGPMLVSLMNQMQEQHLSPTLFLFS